MKLAIATLILASACANTFAQAPTPTVYKKAGAAVAVQRGPKSVDFGINSIVGQDVCNLEGTAVLVDKERFAYTDDDPADKCVAVLNFAGGKLAVTTKGCASSCGLNAAGSMDGTYTLKR